MKTIKFPIKHKLASIILAILIPLIVYSVYHYFEMLEHNKRDIQYHNLKIASTIAKELDELVDKTFGILTALSKHPAVQTRDSGKCDRLFAELFPSYRDHLNIIAADMGGNNYGSAVKMPEGKRINYLDRPWFTRVRDRKPFVSDLQNSKLFGVPAVMIGMPVFDSRGKQVGVVGLPLDLLKIRDRLTESWDLPDKSAITVIDSKGNILIDTYFNDNTDTNIGSGSIVQKALAATSGSEEGISRDGIRRLHSFSPVTRIGWKVIVGVPVAEAYSKAYSMSAHYIIMLLTAGLIGLGLSVLLSTRIAGTLSSLVAGLGEIERGNLSFKLKLSGHDELKEVAESFNKMTEARNEAERKVTESESFLTSVLDGIGEGVIVIDREYKIVSANNGYCRQVRLSCEDIVGRHCYEISHRIEEPCYDRENGCDCAVKKCFETGEQHRAVHTHHDNDGNPLYIETNAYPLKDASGKTVSAIETLMDITDKKKLEAQLFQAQKMEAVGLLAGGIAHDFNNLLTAIIGYGSLAQMKMEKDCPSGPYIEQILASAERAANLTQSLLAFSKKQIIEPRAIKLSDVIRRLQKLLTRIIGEDIALKTFISPHESAVMADASQIEQVLMNLCTNARDAMPEGGTLMIESELMEFDDEYVSKHVFAKPGKYMLISVTDGGRGMDEETREKIFEPFYTTKEFGKGTGLGLSIVYGIVKQHNGYINVYSEPEKGTTFRLYLPVIEKESETLEVPALPPVTGGTETILVAEDEPGVRELARNILEGYGYKVILAEDGMDAVEKFKTASGSIDLLILDALMPKKKGKEVHSEARKLTPGIKVLFMSGYTPNMIHKNGVLDAGIELITKPFSPNAFLRKVREVLDK